MLQPLTIPHLLPLLSLDEVRNAEIFPLNGISENIAHQVTTILHWPLCCEALAPSTQHRRYKTALPPLFEEYLMRSSWAASLKRTRDSKKRKEMQQTYSKPNTKFSIPVNALKTALTEKIDGFRTFSCYQLLPLNQGFRMKSSFDQMWWAWALRPPNATQIHRAFPLSWSTDPSSESPISLETDHHIDHWRDNKGSDAQISFIQREVDRPCGKIHSRP